MRILVTGIEGFAGRHLAKILLEKGHEVSGTVLKAGDVSTIRKELGGAAISRADLRYSRSFERIVSRASPERIVHLAAQSSGSLAMRDPALTYRTNVLGTMNLLEILRRMEWKGRMLVVGSADVYGSPGTRKPLREGSRLSPPNHYAASKAMAELLAVAYHAVHGLRTVRVRSFPHTGPGQSERFALSSFAKQMAEAERRRGGKVLVGNLAVVRDYLDVRDVARAYIALLDRGRDGEVYNVSRGKPQRLGEILEMMRARCTARVEILEDTARKRPIDIEYQVGDPTKLMRETGWRPMIPLGETLEDLLDYWRGKVGEVGKKG